jgi:hypothetical protein
VRVRRSLLWLLALVAVGCALAPRPRVLSEADAARNSLSVKQSEQLAPQAYAHAERLRQAAHDAHSEDKPARAQVLGEHALAAYNHAVVLSRLARAQQRLTEAERNLQRANLELQQLGAQQQKLAAEAEGLEMRIKVARDALPLVPSAPAGAERDTARRQAARTLASQARLLCTATRLLSADAKGLSEQFSKLDRFEQRFPQSGAEAIDTARALRSDCLTLLTKARRPNLQKAPSAGVTDALLKELSEAGLLPFRDDRGVIITLRGIFKGRNELNSEAKERLATLGRVAKAHPSFPVLVVVHTARDQPEGASKQHAQAVADALEASGAAQVAVEVAGSKEPVIDPKRPGAAQRNERLEVVFVAPAP